MTPFFPLENLGLCTVRSVKEAVEIAVEREEGWSSGGENSDGGTPVPIVQQPSPQVKKLMKSQTWQRNNPAVSTVRELRGPWKPETSSYSSTEWSTRNTQWGTSQSGVSTGWASNNSQWGTASSQLNATTEAFTSMLSRLVFMSSVMNLWHMILQGSCSATSFPLTYSTSQNSPWKLCTLQNTSLHLVSNQSRKDRSAPWRSVSASGPVVRPGPATNSSKTAKLESLMKKTSISKEASDPAATNDGPYDTSRWSNPKPRPRPAPEWTVVDDRAEKWCPSSASTFSKIGQTTQISERNCGLFRCGWFYAKLSALWAWSWGASKGCRERRRLTCYPWQNFRPRNGLCLIE